MKKIFITLTFLSLAVFAFGQKPVNPNVSEEAKSLLKKIYSLNGKQTLAGQHNYPLYSDILQERVHNLTDKYPVVFGQDFGYSEPGTLDGINFRQRVIDNAIKWHK